MYELPSTSKMREPWPRLDEQRSAAHAAKGAHGRVHAAGNHCLRAREQGFGSWTS